MPMRRQRAVKLISLRRYLQEAAQAGGQADCSALCRAFAMEVLGRLGMDASFPAGAGLEPEQDPAGREDFFTGVLDRVGEWRRERDRREQEARQEMQLLVAAFNQAVMALADGGDRAAGRFSTVGAMLERAARAASFASMRAAVYEAAETLRRESEAHRAETATQVAALGRRLDEARGRQMAARREDEDRQEAIRTLHAVRLRDGEWAMAAVVFDRLPALQARFGAAVAAEALAAFETDRIAGLAAGGRIYCWSRAMRLWLMEASGDAAVLRDRLEEALGEPYEYRTVTAGRTATLLLEGRWMWGLMRDQDVDALIGEVDLFAAGAPSRR